MGASSSQSTQSGRSKQARTRRYWETVSDDHLLDVDLTTNEPESLQDVVYALPEGDEEPYVEYKYDLRGSDREKLHCVHGNHPHLAGYVMRKGASRFFVGHICGQTIYGENFANYTSDFNAAVNRQDALRRVRDLRTALAGFGAWLEQIQQSELWRHFAQMRGRFREQMPWIYDNANRIAASISSLSGASTPQALFSEEMDPRKDLAKIVADFNVASLLLSREPEEAAQQLHKVKMKLDSLLRGIERLFADLSRVEQFFQPAVLKLICDLATEWDNPKKRRYQAGLMAITCKRDKDSTTIQLPKGFILPDTTPIAELRTVLRAA